MGGTLEGKVAIVTGGGYGLGEAIARTFAEAGGRVIVAGRDLNRCTRVAENIGGLPLAVDVTREDAVAALFHACDQAFGRLDVLVNNAGTVVPWQPIEDIAAADWDSLFAVNLRGVMLCTKHAVPLLKRRGGAIVNMASRVGLRGIGLQSAYSASKFAVIGFTEATARELGPYHIRVNALCPGAVRTEALLARVADRAAARGMTIEDFIKAEIADKNALGRLTEPGEVAKAALFLASAEAEAITGTALRIDAGRF
jgi:NAD(P)-dependent dehydrogenase (short-subunit alcohol dehydrogenase family)